MSPDVVMTNDQTVKTHSSEYLSNLSALSVPLIQIMTVSNLLTHGECKECKKKITDERNTHGQRQKQGGPHVHTLVMCHSLMAIKAVDSYIFQALTCVKSLGQVNLSHFPPRLTPRLLYQGCPHPHSWTDRWGNTHI